MEFKTVAAAIGIILVVIYALGSGIWTSSSPGWYSSLNRPPWQPPDFVFGLIWPYNFIILGIAAVRVSNSLTRIEVIIWLTCFALSVAAALSWAYNFYVPHNLQFAGLSLGATVLLTIPMLLLTFRTSIALGLALLPYQIWVAIATTLAWGYYTRN
ncbi:MAG: tryptophan-rich sensory protein [Actinobacteria bacterium]|nr:tryptophan-rich sensory protein [Actinomycetota bacterium]